MFTKSAMSRPLFEEPTPDLERTDPWSGPQGFMLGGMCHPAKLELGQQYFDAANLLIETIKRGDFEDYRLANPVLFLYRHSLELTLKSIIGSDADKHDLVKLADGFAAIVQREFSRKVASWIPARIKEIAAIDPNSTAFRYAENYSKTLKRHVPVDGEIYVSLEHLQDAMNALYEALLSVLDTQYRSAAMNS